MLPDHLKAHVRRELDRMELLLQLIKAVEAERDARLTTERAVTPASAAMLLDQGIGPAFAAILRAEGFFRPFDNRGQVAAYAGLAPTPWQSGSVDREQGVSKCKSLDLIQRTMSDLTLHLTADMIGEADPVLSMTALQAAAGGGRKAIIDKSGPLATRAAKR